MIVDFRKQQREHPPYPHQRDSVDQLESVKFLGVHITDKLKWSTHTDSVVKKAQQRHFNLRRLKKFGLSPKTLTNFYRCTIESILSGLSQPGMATATPSTARLSRGWCGLHNASPGANYLPALQDTYSTDDTGRPKRSSRTSTTRATACSHPLPSRRRGQ